jgi:hypothetical protein
MAMVSFSAPSAIIFCILRSASRHGVLHQRVHQSTSPRRPTMPELGNNTKAEKSGTARGRRECHGMSDRNRLHVRGDAVKAPPIPRPAGRRMAGNASRVRSTSMRRGGDGAKSMRLRDTAEWFAPKSGLSFKSENGGPHRIPCLMKKSWREQSHGHHPRQRKLQRDASERKTE